MSSYQFVNSMSACYGRMQDVSAVAAADYYGAAMNSYDTCYSPPLNQYGAYTPTGPNPLPTGSQAADFLASASVAAAATGALGAAEESIRNSTPGSSIHSRLHLSSSSPASTPQSNSSISNIPCKYVPNSSEPSCIALGSPQDLTITGTDPVSGGTGSGSEQNTPKSGSGGGGGNGAGSDVGEGSEAGDSTSGSNSKSNPQIYPWMKRVHLGTNSE